MSYRGIAPEPLQHRFIEYVGDKPHLPVRTHGGAVGARYTGTLLAPVLQGVEAQVSDIGCIFIIENSEYTAHFQLPSFCAPMAGRDAFRRLAPGNADHRIIYGQIFDYFHFL